MTEQANKPGGAIKQDGKPRDVDERQAVKNQSTVTPDQYPEPAAGETQKPDSAA